MSIKIYVFALYTALCTYRKINIMSPNLCFNSKPKFTCLLMVCNSMYLPLSLRQSCKGTILNLVRILVCT